MPSFLDIDLSSSSAFCKRVLDLSHRCQKLVPFWSIAVESGVEIHTWVGLNRVVIDLMKWNEIQRKIWQFSAKVAPAGAFSFAQKWYFLDCTTYLLQDEDDKSSVFAEIGDPNLSSVSGRLLTTFSRKILSIKLTNHDTYQVWFHDLYFLHLHIWKF